MSTPKSVIELAKKSGAKMIDIKFVDTFGTWQHFSCPIRELTEEIFTEGLGFDGSSIRGWKSIEASDMLAMPDPGTAFIDPFMAEPTVSLTCTIAETGTLEPYIARSARASPSAPRNTWSAPALPTPLTSGRKLSSSCSTTCSLTISPTGRFTAMDSEEGIWNTGRDEMPNTGLQDSAQGRVFSGCARRHSNKTSALRWCCLMEQLGVSIERQHHEVATAGQAEIDYRFDTLVSSADAMMVYRYVVKNVARRHGKTATFMPKPLFGDNGSGMHTHQSLWKKGKPLFAGNEYARA